LTVISSPSVDWFLVAQLAWLTPPLDEPGGSEDQNTFSSINTTTIRRIRPSPPLGYGPQFRLYGQAGIAPISKSTRMIRRIDMVSLLVVC
jgi:hypothetical protein